MKCRRPLVWYEVYHPVTCCPHDLLDHAFSEEAEYEGCELCECNKTLDQIALELGLAV